MRCFLCIEIKKSEIIKKILQFQRELNSIDAKIKFVEEENFHLTLKFLGNIDPSVVDDIYSIMKKIPFKSFSICLKTVGSFPKTRPRVVWIGITAGQEEILSIMAFLNQNLKSLGFKPEKRKPSVHLTVGRVKFIKDRNLFSNILEKWKDYSFGEMQVTAIQLKKSVLTPKGPIYTTLKEIKSL